MPKPRLSTLTRAVVLAAAVVTALSACGRKGDLEPPGGLPQRDATPASLLGAAVGGPDPAAPPKPDRPFVLDPLI
ncbi:LPS translocon maturation chaperone LptM [Chthonobacter rhizosphaerae]|uniref:LPS translocon maturation chaperone LptM n=1 Tax=Chthonobacter rhizosphaerae TaxID=2735553 RepID=UPI0015EE5739|nr:lipoprotein [Chthonobacter rhizosphaerae]